LPNGLGYLPVVGFVKTIASKATLGKVRYYFCPAPLIKGMLGWVAFYPEIILDIS